MPKRKRSISSQKQSDKSVSLAPTGSMKSKNHRKRNLLHKRTPLNRVRKKIMKYAIKNPKILSTYKIPKEKLDNALELLDNNAYGVKSTKWRCTPSFSINSKNNELISITTIVKLLNEARKCLLKHDWINLARVLSLVVLEDKKIFYTYFPILRKYAEICLAYNPDKELIENFNNGILSLTKNAEYENDDNDCIGSDDDNDVFLKLTTQFSSSIINEDENGTQIIDKNNDDSVDLQTQPSCSGQQQDSEGGCMC